MSQQNFIEFYLKSGQTIHFTVTPEEKKKLFSEISKVLPAKNHEYLSIEIDSSGVRLILDILDISAVFSKDSDVNNVLMELEVNDIINSSKKINENLLQNNSIEEDKDVDLSEADEENIDAKLLNEKVQGNSDLLDDSTLKENKE